MNKVWFVTGTSRGLGRDFAEAALSRGDKVAATARNTERLDELVAAHGDAVLPLELDVADRPAGFATRSGRNPDPLANGHLAEADPIYDGVRRRIAGLMGKQPAGDPAAAAQALLKIVDSDDPPLQVLFGQGFYPMLQQVYADRLKTWADWQDLSAEAHGMLDQV